MQGSQVSVQGADSAVVGSTFEAVASRARLDEGGESSEDLESEMRRKPNQKPPCLAAVGGCRVQDGIGAQLVKSMTILQISEVLWSAGLVQLASYTAVDLEEGTTLQPFATQIGE